MKKIISMGVASAVLALTAVAASAAAEANIKAELTNGELVSGGEVTYTISTAKAGLENAQFFVTTEGLEYVGKTLGENLMGDINEGKVAVFGSAALDEGATLITLTYKVTAAEGEAVKFALAPDPDFADTVVSETPVTDDVAAAGTSEPGTSDNSDESSTGNEGNANTGIALAIVPAVIAGAAVVVAAKKRK